MDSINFTSGGKLGDFIHSMYVVYNICIRDGKKANIYLVAPTVAADGNILNAYDCGDSWTFGIENAYKDLYSLVMSQPYVQSFEILGDKKIDNCINLNNWRATGGAAWYYMNDPKCWSEILSDHYQFPIGENYQWLTVTPNTDFSNSVIIHRSDKHHTETFPWQKIIDMFDDIYFLATSLDDWYGFEFKNDKMKPYSTSSVEDVARAMAGCKMFIGNQSAPFAIASAVDCQRLVELYGPNYNNETNYSRNISWYSKPDYYFFNKYVTENLVIGLK